MEALKACPDPCPCCGGSCRVILMDGWYRVVCDGCGLMSGHYGIESRALAAWNRRAPNPGAKVEWERKGLSKSVRGFYCQILSMSTGFYPSVHTDSGCARVWPIGRDIHFPTFDAAKGECERRLSLLVAATANGEG